MLRFDLSAGSSSRIAPAAKDLDLDPGVFSEIKVDIALFSIAGKRRLQIQARAMAALECDRTLRPFTLPIAGTHVLELLAPGEAFDADGDVEPLFVALGQDIVNLTVAVRDTLLLAIPARKVAPDAEKSELQTVFGASGKHIDWRWETLRSSNKLD